MKRMSATEAQRKTAEQAREDAINSSARYEGYVDSGR